MQFMKLKWMSNIETCSLKYCAITDWISLCTNQNMIETVVFSIAIMDRKRNKWVIVSNAIYEI